eukprot:UC4_evm1s156
MVELETLKKQTGVSLATNSGPNSNSGSRRCGSPRKRFDCGANFGQPEQPKVSIIQYKNMTISPCAHFEAGKPWGYVTCDFRDIVIPNKGNLGRGAFGTVSAGCFPLKPKLAVAIKEIELVDITLNPSKEPLHSYLEEIDILRSAKSHYILMDGGSLADLSKGGVLFPENILKLVAKVVLEAMKLLRDKLSKMHRDIKPDNILFNRKGEVKLCDFGISGSGEPRDESGSITIQTLFCSSYKGTLQYMAPER